MISFYLSQEFEFHNSGYLIKVVYYYRTFRFQDSKISIFCVIYFHFSLARKYIEQLADEIYERSKNSDEKIEISSHIDNLIFNNIEYSENDSIIELFSKNFDTNLYTNISFID